MRKATIIYTALGALLAAGAYLRLVNLSGQGFWMDEFFHVFAAKSLLADGTLAVPLHGEYTRALPITYLTAASFRLLGESEVAARLPFVLVNLVFVAGAIVWSRRLFSWPLAIPFAAVMALSPFMVAMSRECRMYTVFQAAYFAMSWLFFLGFEGYGRRGRIPGLRRIEERFDVNAALLLASLGAFAVSVSVHDLTFNFAFVMAAYALVMTGTEWVRAGAGRALRSKYVVLLAVMGFAFLALALQRTFLEKMLRLAIEIPAWAKYERGEIHYYRYLLTNAYPFLVLAYPFGAALLLRAYGRKGLFAVLSFVVLFGLHSVVFGRRGDRYIFYLFPFFALGGAALFAWIGGEALRFARRASPLGAVPATVFAAALFALFAHPWVGMAAVVPYRDWFPNWKAISRAVAPMAEKGAVITTSPMPYIYYVGRPPDFYFLGEAWTSYPHGDRLIRTPEAFRSALARSTDVYLVTDVGRFGNKVYITDDMEAMIRAGMTPVSYERDERVRLYRRTAAVARAQ